MQTLFQRQAPVKQYRTMAHNGARHAGRLAALGLALSMVSLAACASAGGRTEGVPIPIQLQVINNLRLPTDLTVYAVTRAGNRTLLGGVHPGATTNLTFTPVSFSEPYRLLATTANGRSIRSQSFSVVSDMTGAIVWTLVPNIVGFEIMDADSVASP
ncbi:MAG: hypothetical protein ABI194_00490 [Gemmatimonadaceae bacterium]